MASLALCLKCCAVGLVMQSDRVLKQNRGSAGEGIWVVKPHGWSRKEGAALLPDALLQCTEMLDNSTHIFQLSDFMQMCLQYIEGVYRPRQLESSWEGPSPDFVPSSLGVPIY